MAMQLNSVVYLSPYATHQTTASKQIHEAFDILKTSMTYFNADIIAYRSDGQIILGRNYSDVDERVYEYDKLDFSAKNANALFDLLGKKAVNGEIPRYDPQVHIDTLDRFNKRFRSGKSSAHFLAYAFIRYYVGQEKFDELDRAIKRCRENPKGPVIIVDSISQANNEGEA